MRLYDPTQGDILVDGISIRDYAVEEYRNSIGAVFQDFKIFAGTVAENIILDDAEPDRKRAENALERSGLRGRVDSLPEKTETQLTTEFAADGVNLSGGESQKLAISRIFYKDAGLIILDEPSSALDPIAEYQLNHSMLEATENKTVIFISTDCLRRGWQTGFICLNRERLWSRDRTKSFLRRMADMLQCGRHRQGSILAFPGCQTFYLRIC